MKKIVLGKFPRENSHPEKSQPSSSPLENSSWNIPTHVLKYFHSSFLNVLFFHYCHRYHWYYLKECFVILCFKSAEVFTFANICQNEVLSKEKQLMKWVGIFQVGIFRGEFSRGRLMDGNFPGRNFPRTIFSYGVEIFPHPLVQLIVLLYNLIGHPSILIILFNYFNYLIVYTTTVNFQMNTVYRRKIKNRKKKEM